MIKDAGVCTGVLLALSASIFFILSSLAQGASANPRDVVVLVTLDGVRTKEMCAGIDPTLSGGRSGQIFNIMKSPQEYGGKLWGCDESSVRIGNPYGVSLPAYQSIFAGKDTGCKDNECSRVAAQTFAERLVQEGGLRKRDVVTFASWRAIALAVEHTEGATSVDAGRGEHEAKPPWEHATGEVRYDEDTMRLALARLRTDPPAFMYVSLNDSDSLAHEGSYSNVIETLERYDRWIGEIIAELEKLNSHVLLIVTTDHGRGMGAQWIDHGPDIQGSENIWLYVWNPDRSPWASISVFPRKPLTHLSIAPSIIAFFGLDPEPCKSCGVLTSWLQGELIAH